MTMSDAPTADGGPGFLAFLAFFILALALWFLMRNMNARMRRMSYRQQAAHRGKDDPQVAPGELLSEPDGPDDGAVASDGAVATDGAVANDGAVATASGPVDSAPDTDDAAGSTDDAGDTPASHDKGTGAGQTA